MCLLVPCIIDALGFPGKHIQKRRQFFPLIFLQANMHLVVDVEDCFAHLDTFEGRRLSTLQMASNTLTERLRSLVCKYVVLLSQAVQSKDMFQNTLKLFLQPYGRITALIVSETIVNYIGLLNANCIQYILKSNFAQDSFKLINYGVVKTLHYQYFEMIKFTNNNYVL